MNLKLQALLPLLLYLLLWFGYVSLLQGAIGWGPAAVLGFFCALTMMVLIGVVVATWRVTRSHKLMELTRHAMPRVNMQAVFEGRLEPVSESAEGPLSGKPCVAWEYEFEVSALDETGKVDHDFTFEGFGLGQVATQVVMPYGKIPICAGALFDYTSDERISRTEGAKRAHRLLGMPDLRVVSGASNLGSMLSDLSEMMNEDGGTVRLDYVRGPWPCSRPLGRAKKMREKRIEAGSEVTVQGLFDAGRGTIVPSSDGILIAHVPRGAGKTGEAPSPWRDNLALILIVVFINLIMHAMVVMALIAPPDF